MSKRDMTEVRTHLLDMMHKLQNGTADHRQASAMAELGSVLVESAKAEVAMMRQLGMTTPVTAFLQLDGSTAERPALAEPELPINRRYGHCAGQYYARVVSHSGKVKLVQVGVGSLREQLGDGPMEDIPVYSNYQEMKSAMNAEG